MSDEEGRFVTRNGQIIDLELVAKHIEVQERGMLGIGRFLFQFSQLEFTIKSALAGILNLEDGLFDIVTSPYDFASLVRVWCKLKTHKNQSGKEEYEDIRSRLLALNDTRVIVAHAMWADHADGLIARHVVRSKLEAKEIAFTSKEFNRLADEGQMLLQEVLGVKRFKVGEPPIRKA